MNKLKFNVLEKTKDETRSTLENFLINKGIEYPEKFLNPLNYATEFYTNPQNFHNLSEAADILLKSLSNNNSIGILVDDDADGYTSTAALLKYFKLLSEESIENIGLLFHENKSHGLTNEIMSKIKDSDYDLIIIPDAASNDFDQQIEILESGKKLIILDHHMVDNQDKIEEIKEKYKDNYALVNNQLKLNYTTEHGEYLVNREFTGAGVVYKFCEMLDTITGNNYSEDILDLVALGQIADASDISDYEIRSIIVKGLNNIQSPILKFMFSEKIENNEPIAPINLSFTIIPIINAISRIGDNENKQMIIKALYGHWNEDETIIVNRRRKSKITGKFNKVDLEWSMYEYAHDTLTKIKAKQDKIVMNTKKAMTEHLDLGNLSIITVPKDLVEYRSTTGLIANKFVTENMTPTLVLVEDEEGHLSGSARGYEGAMKDFRTWCLDTGLFDLAQGHDNAFGVEVSKDNIDKLIELSNKGFEVEDTVYDVDKLYYNESNLEEVKTVNEVEHIFGGKVNSPNYGYEDLIVSRKSMSQRGSVVTFYHKGLEFIAYKQEPGLIDDILQQAGFKQYFSLDLIGRPSKNEWTGRVKHQIVLQDFTINILDEEPVETKEESQNKWLNNEGNLSF